MRSLLNFFFSIKRAIVGTSSVRDCFSSSEKFILEGTPIKMYTKLFCAIFLSLFVLSHVSKFGTIKKMKYFQLILIERFQQGKLADNAPSYLKTLMQCKSKEGATEEDVTRHMGFQDALSHAGKCIASCMEEALGIVIINQFYFIFILIRLCSKSDTIIMNRSLIDIEIPNWTIFFISYHSEFTK